MKILQKLYIIAVIIGKMKKKEKDQGHIVMRLLKKFLTLTQPNYFKKFFFFIIKIYIKLLN